MKRHPWAVSSPLSRTIISDGVLIQPKVAVSQRVLVDLHGLDLYREGSATLQIQYNGQIKQIQQETDCLHYATRMDHGD